jgi:hypothetical protein
MAQAISMIKLTLMSRHTVRPVDYLNYARRDIITGDTRALVNALSNIKRAIDCQLDVLLEMYGLLKLSTKKKWVFPKKIEVIRKIGIISPNILKKINSRRNQLEHHHKKPKKEEVLDFLDIAELFIELFRFRTHKIDLLIDYDKDFAFWMDREQNVIRIYDNTKLFWDSGGIHMFKETVQEKDIEPVQTIPISDIDSWTDACNRYIRR